MRLQYLLSHTFAYLLIISCYTLQPTISVIAGEIYLTTGEIIKGQITSRNDKAVTIEHEIFGPISIPTNKISSINEKPIADRQGSSTPLDAIAPAEIDINQDNAVFTTIPIETNVTKSNLTKFLEEWATGLEVGFNGASGNSNSLNFYTALNMKKQDDANSDRFRFRYFFESKKGDATRNNGDATWWHDWNFTESKWLYSLITKVETDEFKSWDYRMTGNLGVGYRLSEEDPLKTTLRAGLGATKEFGSIEENFEPEGSFGFELSWIINGWLSLQTETSYLPKLVDTNDYRVLTSLDWLIKLDNRLKLKLGIDNEYDSMVDPGNENNDLKTYGAIVVQY